ncbi:MAG: Mur ligase family protein [Candidatus Dojkabacteria bacterium]|nr:Mur ligase family protein [Candidatus Dojkabacteria bacterium]
MKLKDLAREIYLFQLEYYDIKRYLKASKHVKEVFFERKIDFTPKLISILIASILSLFLINLIIYHLWGISLTLILFILFSSFIYIHLFKYFLIIGSLFVYPIELIIKNLIYFIAKLKLKRCKNLIVIGIAGSYGKTSTKNIISYLLEQKYIVLKTDKSINTPLGICKIILKQLNKSHDFFVVEIGEYKKGDVREIANIVEPHIGIITGINEAHNERMGGIKNAIETIFEITESKKIGEIYINIDDINIKNSYKKYESAKYQFVPYSSSKTDECGIEELEFDTDGNGQKWKLQDFKSSQTIIGKTKLIAEYALGLIMLCYLFNKRFNIVSTNQFIKIIEHYKGTPHRLYLIKNSKNLIIIDDSYNSNPNGAKEAIKTLAKFKNRRKIYITPGIVELGDLSYEKHFYIGELLAGYGINVILLIENSNIKGIIDGALSKGFRKENIIIFRNRSELHKNIEKFTEPGDVLLFQNDVTENYF